MKITPTYPLAGAVIGFVAVALAKGTWKSHMALFGAGAGAIIFATVGAYYNAPKTADEVIAADKKLAETKASIIGHLKHANSFSLAKKMFGK